MEDLKKLKLALKGIHVLYVEDNEALRMNASKLLYKLFDEVDVAMDGAEGLKQFEKHHHPLVITDIKMPNMDGIALSDNIRKIQPSTNIIILSAFDDKFNLNRAIELGIFRFLKKPVNLALFTDILYEVALKIKDEKDSKKFGDFFDTYFNTQSSMVLVLSENRPIIANHMFLDFFKVDNVEEFIKDYGDLGIQFLEHEEFLYNKLDSTWFDEVSKNENKHFNAIIKNKNGEDCHMILKYQKLPNQDDYGVLSLEDVTDLNLLNVVDKKFDDKKDEIFEKNEGLFTQLKQMKDDGVKVELHNYYKGLSITNSGTIKDVKDDLVIIETIFLQQKAIQFEKRTVLTSEQLPYAIESNKVSIIGFDMEYSELNELSYVKTSPVSRKTIRVVPEDEHKVSLFVGNKEFHGEIRIDDISLRAVKINLSSFPAGLEAIGEVTLNISLEMDKQPLVINTKARMFRKDDLEHSFSVVFMFEDLQKALLIKYITKRQMAIIREFKGL